MTPFRLYAYIGLALSLLGAGFYVHHSIVVNEDNKIAVKSDKAKMSIKGKQDEIRNNVLTGHAVAVRMRRGDF